MAAPEAQGLRDSVRQTIPARELVPGDIVFLEAGSIVPADLRLLETVQLRVDESSLTGESVPVDKDAGAVLPEDTALADRVNMAFLGTTAVYGRAIGVVVAIGFATVLGEIAGVIEEPQEGTPLQRKLEEFGRVLGILILGVCALVLVVRILRDPICTSCGTRGFSRTSGVPSAPSSGFHHRREPGRGRRARGPSSHRHPLFGRGHAGDVAKERPCAPPSLRGDPGLGHRDLRGQNRHPHPKPDDGDRRLGGWPKDFRHGPGLWPEGQFLVDGRPVDPKELPLLLGALWVDLVCNDAELRRDRGTYRIVGDPTEGALLVVALKAGLSRDTTARVGELPFDSERKRMTTVLPPRAFPFLWLARTWRW